MIEQGSGPPLVLVPGLPGPWQYVAPAVQALSNRFRVLTLSLGPECTIEADVTRILAALDERQIDRAVICGISLGGLVALRFAAEHPDRTAALIVASAPGPGATLRPHHRVYTRWPWLCGPLFVLETPFRLRHETHWTPARIKMLAAAILRAPVSFTKMARRATLVESTDIAADCRRVVSPTLVMTGEERLDDVVPVKSTINYMTSISGATHIVMHGAGHLGPITHAMEFAAIVHEYVRRVAPRADVA